MKYFFIALLILPRLTFALEIDEKLTMRIVNTSESKKTVLINRGIEDGLKQSDHAKFYVSEGVVARAVCIKLSPTRSVWSIYRIVNKGFIRNDQVMKLKITAPVKITKDESRMLVKDDSRASIAKDPRDLGIPLAEGADDLATMSKGLDPASSAELMSMATIDLKRRNKEVFGMMSYSSFTEKATPDDNTNTEFTRTVDNLYLSLGGEYYFEDQSQWYSRFSLVGSFAMDNRAVMDYQGAFVSETNSEFAFGLNAHFAGKPSEVNRFIYYLGYKFAIGSTNSTYSNGNENPNFGDLSLDGAIFAHNFIFGAKYYTTSGIGMRALMNYVFRGDAYSADSSNVSWVKTRIGPRLLVGISYRF